MAASMLAGLLLLFAGQLDVNGLVTIETRAGEAPLVANSPPRAGVWGIAQPAVELRYLSPRFDFRFVTGVRAFWREPNYLNLTRPLFLSVTEMSMEARISRRLTLTLSGGASIGEPDYTALTAILGPSQATIPQGVTEISSVVVSAKVAWDATRRLRLSMGTDFTDRRQIGSETAPAISLPAGSTTTMFVFPRQTSVVVSPLLSYLATRQGDLIATVPMSYGTYSTGSDVFTVAPTAGWRAHLSRDVDLRLLGGMAFADLTGSPSASFGSAPAGYVPLRGWTAAPVGEGTISVRVLTRNSFALGSDSSVHVEYYVDPVLGVGTPRATLGTALALTLGPEWLLGLSGLFATSLAAKGLPLTPPPDETAVFISLPIQHIIPKHFIVEFGGRFVDSAPHYSSGFAFHQRQLFAYVSFTAMTRKPDTYAITRLQ